MKVSKQEKNPMCLLHQRQKVPAFAHKQNIGRTWSIQETQDIPQTHSQGVKQIIAQKVSSFRRTDKTLEATIMSSTEVVV